MSDNESAVCGSWVVTERVEGHEYRVRWCGRIDGPCPFPGADRSKSADRRCGALPGRQLFVTYGEDRLRKASAELDVYKGAALSDAPAAWLSTDTVYVAIDALRACLGDDES